jgi:hypothetical protein
MKPDDRRFQVDVTAARYLDALERDDFAAMEEIWLVAQEDPDLLVALQEIHAGLAEEQGSGITPVSTAALKAAVHEYLPTAEVADAKAGPVTVADVAEELFRHTPDRLSADAHVLNDKLRSAKEPLPDDLGLTGLTAWAEARFGAAPAEYWRAFRQAALKLELRRASEVEYQLAARRAPKAEGKK